MHNYTEDALIEQPAIALLAEMGWQTVNAFAESYGEGGTLGRETAGEVVLTARLLPALRCLNPTMPDEAIRQAIDELTRDRSAMSLAAANREAHTLLRDGVRVAMRDDGSGGEERTETVRVVDWEHPERNDFLLVSQFWVTGEVYRRRADLVGFVNGVPLVFVELKNDSHKLKEAYDKNLTDYREAVPHLFWYNGVVLLSNGTQSVVGSVTAEWEHFGEWKRVASELEPGVISLETMLRGVCEPARLLDIVENFVLFRETKGGLAKIVARNHQVLGVNNAIAALQRARDNQGRLGVFWHTQGSGKSFSMLFFAQKVHRKLPGNWTFLIVTDRIELDGQIYGNFAATGAVTETEAQAASGDDLRRLLSENHRYVFALIQKFHMPGGKPYPVVSERSDIIVMTDEAHRSQYDLFALNMRSALPNAAFIGFTGTPLMAGEEKTREVFGDYVSVYNFKQSVDDGATVPLYYENRIPELQVTNPDFNEQMEALIEDADLDNAQQERLEREFAREYHLITRDDRLETVAEDLVAHFLGRGTDGKAMVVCIDKATAVRLYDKVKRNWDMQLKDLKSRHRRANGMEREALGKQVARMDGTDMAVVVSQSQNEVKDLAKHGADIKPHRKRMVTEDLESKFKDPNDPLRIVFVCAMWMTGFDVPCCSTLYLDKPMRNHTLMQTIARANRVFPDKNNGLIVDYVGVFRDLQRALTIYGSAAGGGVAPGDMPVLSKEALVEELVRAIGDAEALMESCGVRADLIQAAPPLERVAMMDAAVDVLLASEDVKLDFLAADDLVTRLYRAIKPDTRANEFLPRCWLIEHLAAKIRLLAEPPDISAILGALDDLLDELVGAEPFVIREDRAGYGAQVDLSKLDVEALQTHFLRGHQRTEAERLKAMLQKRVAAMIALNAARMDYLERLTEMIEEYNADSANAEAFLQKLIDLSQELNAEEQRHVREQLSEEELAVFDLLTRPDVPLSDSERDEVKRVARHLLDRLKAETLVLDWRKRQQTRAAVRLVIDQTLDDLPDCFTRPLYADKCQAVYQHIYDHYFGVNQSAYAS